MFRVENADFIADKLASELLPDQEQREVYCNGQEAILRRFADKGTSSGGRIEFDVDWSMHARTGEWLLCCADNGDGMTRHELEKYMTTLAVQGANQNQSIFGNQGMGLKIAGPTRHKRGILIRSLKNGERTMVQVGWNGEEYDLIPLGPDGEVVVPVADEMFPQFILEQGSGTVVTFLGSSEGGNTFAPSDRPRGWLFKYLHQRFFRLSDNGIEVRVRVPSGDETEWPHTLEEASQRQRGIGGKSFNLSGVRGTAAIWQDAAGRQGGDYCGFVDVAGDPLADVPAARVHWWVLPSGPGTDVSSRTASGGSIAVLFQNELHDWRTGNQANPYFARLGVLFGKTRIAFILEPLGSTIASDFARAHVLVGGKPVFESDAWFIWSEQFRARMPDRIKDTMSEEQERLQHEDPDRARRIRDRLKDVMQLLRPRRFRRDENGKLVASGPAVTGPGIREGAVIDRPVGGGTRRKSNNARGIGAVLTQVDVPAGESVSEVFSLLNLTPQWVSESQAESFAVVNGNGQGLHDRAAALAGEDGATADILLLNRDFRGYQAIVAAVSEWANPDGDPDVGSRIETFAQEWIEQKMVEAVNGLRQLENGSTWTTTSFDDALSPVALTAAFMADRYHTLREVKRQAGPLRMAPTPAA
ncbi:MAG: ATP-binding protein [Solirubrobacterales bacterium]